MLKRFFYKRVMLIVVFYLFSLVFTNSIVQQTYISSYKPITVKRLIMLTKTGKQNSVQIKGDNRNMCRVRGSPGPIQQPSSQKQLLSSELLPTDCRLTASINGR